MFVMFITNWFRIFIYVCFFSIYISSKSISNSWIQLKINDIGGVSSLNFVDSNDPSRRENYTVSFVPLISVIAHYLPTFLKRLQTQEIIAARNKRSYWPYAYKEICTPYHLGRFPNVDSKCQFFECAMNFKNFINCSRNDYEFSENTHDYDDKNNKQIIDIMELRSKTELRNEVMATSNAVVYIIDKCVSLILHHCSLGHVYNNRLQACLPQNSADCSK